MADITGLTTRASVQAWHDLTTTVHGDVGEIASGTQLGWSGGYLNITKAVTIRGQSPNLTRLQDAGIKFIGDTGGVPNWPSGKHPRISNLTIQWADGNNPTNGIINFAGHINEFEIDHVDFTVNPPGITRTGIYTFMQASSFYGWGLVHHCHFSPLIGGDTIPTDQPAWIPLDGLHPTASQHQNGDGSWADWNYWAGKVPVAGTYLGTPVANAGDPLPNNLMPCFRFQDCIFECDPFSLTTLSGGGARREVRFCTFFNSQTAGHGAETNHPGGRTTEYYNNIIQYDTLQASTGMYNSRSSSSVQFNCRGINSSRLDRVTIYRDNANGLIFNGDSFGSGSGANQWDKNRKGTFQDVFGLTYTTNAGGGAAVVPNSGATEGQGDIYWEGIYPGPNVNNGNGGITLTLTNPSLTLNGTGGDPSYRWKGFVLYNKTQSQRMAGGDHTFIACGAAIDRSTSTTISIMANRGVKNQMDIRTNDVLQIRCVDLFIHQAGSGRGELLQTFDNPAPDDTNPYRGNRPQSYLSSGGNSNMTWNMDQNARMYPGDLIEGLWFWGNKCSLTTGSSAANFVSADKFYFDNSPANIGDLPAKPRITFSENPQQFRLGFNVFLPGTNPAASPTTTGGRPPFYPYDAVSSDTDTRLRIGCDTECYDTFKYISKFDTGGSGRITIPANTTNRANGLCADHYWGRTYPDYLIATTPQITSGSLAYFTVGVSNQEFIVTTSNFTGTPTLSIVWSPNTPPNVSFNNGQGAGGVSAPGSARITGSANGATPADYTATITATVASPFQTFSQPFTLNITSLNVPPTVVWTLPPDGSTYISPATIVLEALPTPHGTNVITKVEFYRGGSILIGTVTSSPYQFTWTGATAGSYSLTAKAYDDGGGVTTTSPAVGIIVNAPSSGIAPPTIVVTT